MIFFDEVVILYADPGAGALILQMLMAAVFGGMFFFRSVRERVMGLFGKKPSGSASSVAEEPTDDEDE